MTDITNTEVMRYQFPPSAVSAFMGPEDWDKYHEGLDEITLACGPNANQHELVAVLVSATIDTGIVSGADIVSILSARGHNAQHVGIILRHHTGNNPQRHRWNRNEQGEYRTIQ